MFASSLSLKGPSQMLGRQSVVSDGRPSHLPGACSHVFHSPRPTSPCSPIPGLCPSVLDNSDRIPAPWGHLITDFISYCIFPSILVSLTHSLGQEALPTCVSGTGLPSAGRGTPLRACELTRQSTSPCALMVPAISSV